MSKKNKIILIIGIAVFAVAFGIILLLRRNSAATQHINNDAYTQVEPYRKSKSDIRVIPKYIEERDETDTCVRYEFDENARNMIIGRAGEIGKYPNRIVMITPDGTERVINRYEYKYDTRGNIISETCYNSDNLLEFRAEYLYYDDGRIRRESIYEPDENGVSVMTNYTMYRYDENNFLIGRECYSGFTLLSSEQIVCNQNGDPSRIDILYDDGSLNGTIKYDYTETGEILSRTELYDDIPLEKMEYIYDSKDYLRTIKITYYDYQVSPEEPYVYSSTRDIIYSEADQSKLGVLNQ